MNASFQAKAQICTFGDESLASPTYRSSNSASIVDRQGGAVSSLLREGTWYMGDPVCLNMALFHPHPLNHLAKQRILEQMHFLQCSEGTGATKRSPSPPAP